MHTDSSLALLETLTTEFGSLMQNFQELTCSQFETKELPREAAARSRRGLKKKSTQSTQNTTNQPPIVEPPTTESVENIRARTGNHTATPGHQTMESVGDLTARTGNHATGTHAATLGRTNTESTANIPPPAPTANSSGKNHTCMFRYGKSETY